MAYRLKKLAELVCADLRGDGNKVIHMAAPFEVAGTDAVTFAANRRYLNKIDQTAAGAVIVPRGTEGLTGNLLLVDHPQFAFLQVLKLFLPAPRAVDNISPRAVIADDVVYGKQVQIGPCAVIEKGVQLGDRIKIAAGVFIVAECKIGDDTVIHPNASILSRSHIGKRVMIHSGTVIGSDGFGFVTYEGVSHKIPHLGIVQIDDDVEIGAGNTIDRATFGRTWIQKGVKTDNLVHVAHNVTVGENTLLVAQVGISGSTTIGSGAILAGQAGVSGHLKIGDHVTIGPQSGIAKSIPSGEVVSGSPEMPHRLWLKVQRILPKLPQLKKKIAALEKRLAKIESALKG
jgi:UDP-3-O-[3-hydroxymyristoyl] glucosamine N-acyltransferase